MTQVKESLAHIGLDGNESEIYLFLLKHQDSPAYAISKDTLIPRTTVYKALEKMEKQGIVSSWIKNGTKHFSPENPSVFKKQLKDKEAYIDLVLPELQDMFSSLAMHPSAKMYQGKKGVQQAFEIMLERIKTKKLKQIYVYSDSLLTKQFPRYFKEWRSRKNKTGAFTYLIVPHDTPMTSDYASDEYRETRILPSQFPFVGSIDICGSSVAFFSFKDKELYSIVIDSPIIAEMLTQFFMYMWQTLKPQEKRL